jgi:N-acetylmuramoyl-L-alanine amidase
MKRARAAVALLAVRYREGRRATRAAGAAVLGLTIAAAGACGPAAAPPPEPPAPVPAEPGVEPSLPPIPPRDAPLALSVVYPPENAQIGVRDSNFIFGSTNTGGARLWIGGAPVPVAPNGAFLAFLPVPQDGIYVLQAAKGAEQARLEHRIRLPSPPPPLPAGAEILAASVAPRGAWAALPGERIDVSFRGSAGGSAWLVLPDGRRVPLVERAARREGEVGVDPVPRLPGLAPGWTEYRGYFDALPLLARDAGLRRPVIGALAPEAARPAAARARRAADASGPASGNGSRRDAYVELVLGGDTARAPLPLNLAIVDPARPPVGLALDPGPPGQTDVVVVARPAPGTTSHFFWPNGTELTLTGQRDGELRVRLGPGLDAWVPLGEVLLQPEGTPPPSAIVGNVRIAHTAEYLDILFPMERRVPFHVEERERRVEILLYGAVSGTDRVRHGRLDPFLERAEWSQEPDSVYRFTLHLGSQPWGWDASWTDAGLSVRVRQPPTVDPAAPLRGLVVVVDPGHGGAERGAPGPTSLAEADANLFVALRLEEALEQAGARVIMTRTADVTVPLYTRTRIAESADAHLLVSIHHDAFPDGVNPFRNYGTGVYYFHPHSADLAQQVLVELLGVTGLRDLGTVRASLALARPRWMPAILTESMFMMVPQQEAALRSPEMQERLARAIARGMEEFVRRNAVAR